MTLLAKEQYESLKNAIICYICQKIENKYLKMKNIAELEIIVNIQGNIKMLHKAYII